jgi:hypothetical protein
MIFAWIPLPWTVLFSKILYGTFQPFEPSWQFTPLMRVSHGVFYYSGYNHAPDQKPEQQ